MAILTDLDNPAVPAIVQSFLSGVNAAPKDAKFVQNCREEVLKACQRGKVLSAARSDGKLYIVIEE